MYIIVSVTGAVQVHAEARAGAGIGADGRAIVVVGAGDQAADGRGRAYCFSDGPRSDRSAGPNRSLAVRSWCQYG